MYEQHWELSARPFENRIDSKYYYPAETHQAALLKLHYAVENRRAAALLCGPSGMGKSLVLDALRRQMTKEISPVCHVVFPMLPSDQLLRYMVNCLDKGNLDAPREASADLSRFEKFLKSNVEAKRHAVILVDEAHMLEKQGLLETLRLLLNVGANEANAESAWTLVLVGQPTLLSHVERYHSLDERMSVKCMLNRLLPEETSAYIQHRITASGGVAEDLFEEQAIERIHILTEGIPRRINRICDLALMVGYAEDRKRISVGVIDDVHSDLAAPIMA